jgi:hypothetical protein
MPKPKKIKMPPPSDTLAEYLTALFADHANRPPQDRDQWREKIAAAILEATRNGQEDPPNKEGIVKALETSKDLLALARLIVDEGKRRSEALGYRT